MNLSLIHTSKYPHNVPAHLALSAGHVVAPLVLLDARLALGALLRVGQDPVRRLALVLALLLPQRQLGARRRGMRLLPAPEAEDRPAPAPHAPRVAERRLHHHPAVLPRAEPKRLVDVHEARQGELLVPLEVLGRQELGEHRLARDLGALVLGARGVHARRALLHLMDGTEKKKRKHERVRMCHVAGERGVGGEAGGRASGLGRESTRESYLQQ